MDSGPPECQEGILSMELAGETAKKRGGGTANAFNVLLGGGPGSITLWDGDQVLVLCDVPKTGGSTRGITKSYNRAEGKAEERQELAKVGRDKFC